MKRVKKRTEEIANTTLKITLYEAAGGQLVMSDGATHIGGIEEIEDPQGFAADAKDFESWSRESQWADKAISDDELHEKVQGEWRYRPIATWRPTRGTWRAEHMGSAGRHYLTRGGTPLTKESLFKLMGWI